MVANKWRCWSASVLLVLLLAPQAQAVVVRQDLEVAARTFRFINGLPMGIVDVMVIYDPSNTTSKTDAEAAMNALAVVSTTKHSFKPVLTPVSDIGNAKIAYVAAGLSARQLGTIGNIAVSKGIFTFTKDESCVMAQQCAMYATSSPMVEIRVSQSALAAAKYELASALKMMVKEVQ